MGDFVLKQGCQGNQFLTCLITLVFYFLLPRSHSRPFKKKEGGKKKTPPERKSTISTLPPFKRVKKKTHKSTIVSRDPPMTRGAATDRGWWKYPERRRRRCCTFDRFISYVYRCETPARQVRSRHRLRSSSYEHSIARHASLDAFS